MKIIATTLLVILIAAAAAGASTLEHPFVKPLNTTRAAGDLGLIEWGRTSISYSSCWFGGGSSSQGLLLKGMRMNLAPNLDFEASFGMSFLPMNNFESVQGGNEFVLPYAAINWRPSEHFSMRLEYSQYVPGSAYGLFHPNAFSPYGYDRRPRFR